MPRTRSAKRALKKSAKRRTRNLQKKKEIKLALKNLMPALRIKDKEAAMKNLAVAYKKVDKAAKTFLHKNKAARIKSRLAKQVFKHLNITKMTQ